MNFSNGTITLLASAPASRTLTLGASTKPLDPTKIAFIQATVRLVSALTAQRAVIEISSNNTTFTVVGSTQNTQTGLSGAQDTQNQMNALVPINWWYRIRQTQGSGATITDASEQTISAV